MEFIRSSDIKAKLKTFLENMLNGNIKSKQMKVLNHIKQNKPIGREIKTDIISMKKILAISHQSLTASLSVLEDCGLVKVIGQLTYDHITGSTYSIYQYVEDETEREYLANARHYEKFKMWIATGVKQYDMLIPHNVINELKAINKRINNE